MTRAGDDVAEWRDSVKETVARWMRTSVMAGPAPQFTWRSSSLATLKERGVPAALAEKVLELGAPRAVQPGMEEPKLCAKGKKQGDLLYFGILDEGDACAVVDAWQPSAEDVEKKRRLREQGRNRSKRRRASAEDFECPTCGDQVPDSAPHVTWPCGQKTCKQCMREPEGASGRRVRCRACPEAAECFLPLARVALMWTSAADEAVLEGLLRQTEELAIGEHERALGGPSTDLATWAQGFVAAVHIRAPRIGHPSDVGRLRTAIQLGQRPGTGEAFTPAQVEALVTAARQHVQDRLANNRCPKCGRVYGEFANCTALSCHAEDGGGGGCGTNFCGTCGALASDVANGGNEFHGLHMHTGAGCPYIKGARAAMDSEAWVMQQVEAGHEGVAFMRQEVRSDSRHTGVVSRVP